MAEATMSGSRCVVVGASLAGLRAVEGLRRAGFRGEIVVVGSEAAMPYNRPPISKGVAAADLSDLLLRVPKVAGDVNWRLGQSVVAADLDRKVVTLDDGNELGWDGLVCATGLSARRLRPESPVARHHVLRTYDDAVGLYADVERHGRLLVIGAGFVACEVAAVARGRGAIVDLVAPEAVPILRVLGEQVGSALAEHHRGHGVNLHLGYAVTGMQVSDVTTMNLPDGGELSSPVVLEAIGSVPNVEWLQGNDLDLTDGILCDVKLRVAGRPDVVACGDVVRRPDAAIDTVPRRIEHWTTAAETARAAGANLAAHLLGTEDATPFDSLPSFWSDQYDLRIRSFGWPALGSDDVRILQGDVSSEFAAGYYRDDKFVGVVLFGLAERLAFYRDFCRDQLAGAVPIQVGPPV